MRSFYDNDSLVTTTPGINAKIPDKLEQQEKLHNISFVEGMGVRTAPHLEKYFNHAREFLHETLNIWSAEINTQTSALLNEFHHLKSQVQSVVREPLLLHAHQVVLPTLLGAILVNRRGLLLRCAVPTALFAASSKYYLPETWGAISGKVANYEKETYPDLYKLQVELRQQAAEVWNESLVWAEVKKADLTEQIGQTRRRIAELWD